MDTKGNAVLINHDHKFLSFNKRDWVTTDGQFYVGTPSEAASVGESLPLATIERGVSVVVNYGYENEEWSKVSTPDLLTGCLSHVSPDKLDAALVKIVRCDLTLARRKGEILICQTKRGTLSLTYAGGVYTLTAMGVGSEVLAKGKPAVVTPVLAGLYDVVLETA